MKPWCCHCDARPARRRDGICDACNTYRSKYGGLPGHGVLRRRQERIEGQGGMDLVVERFMASVDRRGLDECWQWQGGTDPSGYGYFCFRGTQAKAHQTMYRWAKGPVPDGLEIDHNCGNRGCVNPAHLDAVTHSENMRRAHARKRERLKVSA